MHASVGTSYLLREIVTHHNRSFPLSMIPRLASSRGALQNGNRRQFIRWRICATEPGSRLKPKERESLQTVQSPQKLKIKTRKNTKTPSSPTKGIKRELDPERDIILPVRRTLMDGAIDAEGQVIDVSLAKEGEEELKLLEGPLSGAFRCFSFHEGVDVYVAENDEGQLNLAQNYLFDREARIYAMPFCSDEVPDAFQSYQVLEWDTWISADSMANEKEGTEVHKVFFVGQLPLKDERSYPDVDFKELYCIHGAKRTIDKPIIIDQTDENTVDPVLSILEGEVIVRDTRDCPHMENYAQAADLVEYVNHQLKANEELSEYETEFLEELPPEEQLP